MGYYPEGTLPGYQPSDSFSLINDPRNGFDKLYSVDAEHCAYQQSYDELFAQEANVALDGLAMPPITEDEVEAILDGLYGMNSRPLTPPSDLEFPPNPAMQAALDMACAYQDFVPPPMQAVGTNDALMPTLSASAPKESLGVLELAVRAVKTVNYDSVCSLSHSAARRPRKQRKVQPTTLDTGAAPPLASGGSEVPSGRKRRRSSAQEPESSKRSKVSAPKAASGNSADRTKQGLKFTPLHSQKAAVLKKAERRRREAAKYLEQANASDPQEADAMIESEWCRRIAAMYLEQAITFEEEADAMR
ncbi:uncharacterized protein B0H18DRAFT_981833 [Fomitopsis serialis]|uniref:uncharacterized protein n=1 Tax=Fomitopsis serialis TaxID=139415 RepID=UPI002007DDD9|nr:uncharacterized protein B0H18DRAFT_981833 [Neoantrodia serialis]KAH9933743.1 hypothetical protein B0H18DRAFT_981833 [Neoantrodia serialis]